MSSPDDASEVAPLGTAMRNEEEKLTLMTYLGGVVNQIATFRKEVREITASVVPKDVLEELWYRIRLELDGSGVEYGID